jgi:hypothetical protein
MCAKSAPDEMKGNLCEMRFRNPERSDAGDGESLGKVWGNLGTKEL